MNQDIGIFHNADVDGLCCGAIMRYKWPDIQLYGVDYYDKIDINQFKDKNVIIADFAFEPYEYMIELSKCAKSITWVDHHTTNINNYKSNPINGNVILDSDHSACYLLWKILFNSAIPVAVSYISLYDTWKHNDNNTILAFQSGLTSYDIDPINKSFHYIWIKLLHSDNILLDKITQEGINILRYKDVQSESLVKKFAYNTKFEGFTALAMNTLSNSKVFKSHPDYLKVDMYITFYYCKSKWKISMYSGKVDVSEIAKKYNGGGHKGAAGFMCDSIPNHILESMNG